MIQRYALALCESCDGCGTTEGDLRNRDCQDCLGTGYAYPQKRILNLQSELSETIKQRDALAEALRGPVNAAKAADSPSWSEPGESGWYVEEYERTNAKNWLANTKNWLPEAIEALAAVKGGSHE